MKNIMLALLAAPIICAAQITRDDLKMNQIQIIGSHNSYKKAIEPEVYKILESQVKDHGLQNIQYEHIAIPEQLDLGLRNLEIDVYADSKGGKYAHPAMIDIAKLKTPYDPDGKMLKPGFKMIHIPDVDFESWCYTFADCLADLKKWSAAHPGHLPVFITLETKEGEKNRFGTVPEKYTTALLDALDTEIKTYLGIEKIITPDAVRGNYATLNDAVLHGNWPALAEARGKFMFIMDNGGAVRDLYIAGHPSLQGRMIFTNSEPGTPESAALIMNEPADPKIPGLVKAGYIIRTRADADTKEARKNDYSRFELAKKSGAQIITTEYYYPSRLFQSDYKISFEDGRYERVNPVFSK